MYFRISFNGPAKKFRNKISLRSFSQIGKRSWIKK